ncbi:MAG: hypothetical protein CBE43_00575 [Rhodopirellula sp. TMED283]|nr:MAG: hypothetical protein CBE43_00575 [Rhodopirellula sp. TMED283]
MITRTVPSSQATANHAPCWPHVITSGTASIRKNRTNRPMVDYHSLTVLSLLIDAMVGNLRTQESRAYPPATVAGRVQNPRSPFPGYQPEP